MIRKGEMLCASPILEVCGGGVWERGSDSRAGSAKRITHKDKAVRDKRNIWWQNSQQPALKICYFTPLEGHTALMRGKFQLTCAATLSAGSRRYT